MLTAAQVDKAFDEDFINDENPDWATLEYNHKQSGSVYISGDYHSYEVLDSKFGEEGDYATDTFVVVRVGEQVFRKTGYYRSHDGEYWTGSCMEVAPVEKVVTVWEDKPVPEHAYGEFTADDVEAGIRDSDLDWYELGDSYGSNPRITLNGHEYEIEPVKDIGGEGQGEYAAVIFRINGRLFRKEGYYASHYGTDWDGDFSEVVAYEKTVTAYKPV